jgi:hypothetical protein
MLQKKSDVIKMKLYLSKSHHYNNIVVYNYRFIYVFVSAAQISRKTKDVQLSGDFKNRFFFCCSYQSMNFLLCKYIAEMI